MEPDDVTGAPDAAGAHDPTRRISRRGFLIAGGLGAAGVAAFGVTVWPAGSIENLLGSHRLAPSSSATAADGPVLVLLTLYGGNDGLNTVVPYEDPAYAPARGPVAIAADKVLPLSDGFGLHPAMSGFQKLFQSGQLAVVHGVGYPDPNLSHFASMDIWQSATPDGDQSTGWIGRWLDSGGDDPLRAVSVGPIVPLALMGGHVQGAAVPPPPLTLPGTPQQQAAYAAMASATRGAAVLEGDIARSGSDLLTVERTLAPVLDAPQKGSSGATTNLEGGQAGALAITQGGGGRSTSTVLSQQLDLVATMIEAKVPTKVYAVSLGGFDTHTDQAATQQALLSELDSAVPAFLSRVGTAPGSRPVAVLVHTEFGRRVAANASGGTDHGTANVVLLAGPHVKGGFYGDAPSLTKLDDDGNLVADTDFRSVYAAVFEHVLGAEPKDFLGGSFPSLPVLA
ncbi:MAG TPA: DUF1501 domain-containing protein [Acidimicrobiales bacterium]|nr:DUF1501 domain-containing protein [Acidimicrobiales bacterium]